MPDRTVFVVDDDSVSRVSMLTLVVSLGLPSVAYDSGQAFLAAITPRSLGCALIDLKMPGLDGLAVQRHLCELGSMIDVIIVTAYPSTAEIVQAMRMGAISVIEKPCDVDELTALIRQSLTHAGERRSQHARLLDIKRRIDSLTADESLVLHGLVAGKSNKALALEEDVSLRTIEARRHNVFEKTGTQTLAELCQLVYELRQFDSHRLPSRN